MADAMVNNKQVNFWRGDQTPPTIYHIWIKDNSKMLLYDGEKWVVFLDNKEIIEIINTIQQQIEDLKSKTVNKKPIINNPIINSTDIPMEVTGNFIDDTVSQTMLRFDKLLTTQIIE